MKFAVADYEEIRQYVLPGDVILFSARGPISSIIRRVTKSNVSHAGIVTWSSVTEEGEKAYRVYVTDSTSLGGRSGVDTRLLSDTITAAEDNGTTVYWLPLSTHYRSAMSTAPMREYLYSMQGRKYDFWQVFRLGVKSIFGRTLFGVRASDKNVFCSEFVAFALMHGHVWYFDNPSQVTPVDIARLPIYSADGYEQLTGESFIPIEK